MEKSCYLICGQDDYQVEFKTRELLDRLVPAEKRAYGLETIDGRVETVDACAEVLGRCFEALSMDGLFGGGAKLTWLREPAFLNHDRVGKSERIKDLVEELTRRIRDGLPEGQSLLITTTRINRASRLFKALKKAGDIQDCDEGVNFFHQERAAREKLTFWAPKYGLRFEPDAANAFLQRVGMDTRRMVSELEKLRCYCGRSESVTLADVESIVAAGRDIDIWNVQNAFGARDAATMIAQLRRQFAVSQSPIGIAAMLESYVNKLLLLREALDRNWAVAEGRNLTWRTLPDTIAAWQDAADKDIRKMGSYQASRLIEQANCWTLRELRLARHWILRLREELVSTGLPPEWLAETRLLQALGARGARRRTPRKVSRT